MRPTIFTPQQDETILGLRHEDKTFREIGLVLGMKREKVYNRYYTLIKARQAARKRKVSDDGGNTPPSIHPEYVNTISEIPAVEESISVDTLDTRQRPTITFEDLAGAFAEAFGHLSRARSLEQELSNLREENRELRAENKRMHGIVNAAREGAVPRDEHQQLQQRYRELEVVYRDVKRRINAIMENGPELTAVIDRYGQVLKIEAEQQAEMAN